MLKLDRNTPDYIVMKETNGDDLIIKTGKRALKYEKKLKKQERNTILGECWKIQKRRREEKSQEDKREFLKKRRWSIEKYWEDKDREESVWQRLEEKGREIQTNYREERIKDSRYAEEIKEVLLEKQGRRYLERGQRLRKELSTVARFRTGNESRKCMFWLKEEERLYRLCGKEEESYEHVFENCGKVKNKNGKWREILEGEKRSLGKMKEVLWKRKEEEKNKK